LEIKVTYDDLVFGKYNGLPLRPDTISRAWDNTARRAGVKRIRFHDGRHTMASRMLEMGINPKVVQERLEHSTYNTTMDIYGHIGQTLQKDAANKFDEILNIDNQCERTPVNIVL
jgi:integrase